MSERLDAVMGRKSKDGQKTYWTKIGAAFPNKQGEGYTVVLDAMPAPEDGQYRISLFVPKEDDGRGRGGGRVNDGARQRPVAGGGSVDLDDGIPFAPEWR